MTVVLFCLLFSFVPKEAQDAPVPISRDQGRARKACVRIRFSEIGPPRHRKFNTLIRGVKLVPKYPEYGLTLHLLSLSKFSECFRETLTVLSDFL